MLPSKAFLSGSDIIVLNCEVFFVVGVCLEWRNEMAAHDAMPHFAVPR